MNGGSDLYKNFKKCDKKTTSNGEYTVYRCIFGKKSGYKSCPSKVKVFFPDEDNTVILYSIPENHLHEKVEGNEKVDRFSWKANEEADAIAREGVKHNDTPGQIRLQMQKVGVYPLPTTRQINNFVKFLRTQNIDNRLVIGNTEELRNAIDNKTEVPEDIHEPFINSHEIKVQSDGTVKFHVNIVTKNLLERLKSNPIRLFQLDPTYKLMEKGYPAFVHGTSNRNHEFFGTGMTICTNEDADTYKKVFESMEVDDIEYFMGDGDKGLTKAFKEVWPNTKEYEIPIEETEKNISGGRLMCHVHVEMSITKSKKVPSKYEKDVIEDVQVLGRSETREEFDEISAKFQNKWKQKNDEEINSFLVGFENTWVKSNKSNWWSGAGPIDHNNGLEAKNRDIKKNKTLRPKQRLGDFFLNAFDIVKQMSINDKAERIFSNPLELITPTEMNDGWQWLLRHKEKSDIVQIKDRYYVKSEQKESEKLVD